jgi:two-component system phosphate regulon response regulator PhoB
MAKILFVDDDPVTLELMGQAAKLLGHQALLARSGKQALETAHSSHPGMIFLDMMMPGQNGLEVLQELRKSPETVKTPVIILSAGTSQDDAIVCQNAGATDYLPKPIPLQTLMETIQKYNPA